ncbi:MAG: diguanylate cyclase [Phormidesmis sp.]
MKPDELSSHCLLRSKQELQQMHQYLTQQKQLRKVERSIRSSLNLSAMVGTTVTETASLFQARQVSLLRHQPQARAWQPVAQYAQNQSLAWQSPLKIERTLFSHLVRQLKQGKSLRLVSSHASGMSGLINSPLPSVVGLQEGLVGNSPTYVQQRRAQSWSGLNIAMVTADEEQQWLTRWPGNWLLVPVNRAQATDVALQGNHLEGNWPNYPRHGHWGVMAIALPERESWTAEMIAAAQSIAVELSLAIAQSQQYQEVLVANQELQKLALSDGLTRLANRRRFDEYLANEWQRLARDQRPLSLILCDLDHFKRYNDAFGHPAGDHCLIRVARALLNGPQRPADLVARYGGEEFAIILPNTDTRGAWRIAQKIHDSIRALKIAHAPDNHEPYVTVTMGVSTVVPGHDATAQMLVGASDLALYHAKQQGRNRTYVHAHYNTVELGTTDSAASALESQPKILPAASSLVGEVGNR